MIKRIWLWIIDGCDHKDEIIETVKMQSAVEIACKTGATEFSYNPFDIPKLFREKLVTIVQCKYCGRVKHITSQVTN